MSIFHRSAYLSLSALLAIVPAACGGDDDDDNGGGAADSGGGGQADAGGGGTPDSGGGTPDSGGGTPDAAPVVGDQFLLGVLLTDLPLIGGDGTLRLIATANVADDGSSADFSLQPVFSPNCPDQGESGIPAGEALSQSGVAIDAGAFALTFTDVAITDGTFGTSDANGNPTPTGCTIGAAAMLNELTVTGNVVKTGFCGQVAATTSVGDLNGTFGTIAIETGTQGADLPDPPATDCP
jgi:hypothetical protein